MFTSRTAEVHGHAVPTGCAVYPAQMRDTYHDELDAISASLVEMTNLVGSAMSRATTALLDADLQLAESVIANDEAVDTLYRETEARAFDLLARQQPVASDLRVLVTSLRMVADLERMGDNAVHVAKIARRRYPASAVPPALRGTSWRWATPRRRSSPRRAASSPAATSRWPRSWRRTTTSWTSCTGSSSGSILDDRWEEGVEPAIDITLAGRYYERFADHAVSVARRVVYLVTGERPDVP
jgi:phosphate transport system protein